MISLSTHQIAEFFKPLIYINKLIKPLSSDTVTILAYHSISHYRNFKHSRHYTINPQLFDLQMNFLHDYNFNVISLSEFYKMIQTSAPANYKTVVLTFDDGYADSYYYAYPILKKYGFSGTFFLICSFVGSKKIFPWLHEPLLPLGENLPLSLAQILDMAKGGMDFGSHTNSHRRLTWLYKEQAIEEIQGSKNYIEELLGREINSFSYPYGSWRDFDRSHQEIIRNAGYRLAVTTIYGSNTFKSNPLSLRRISIYANDNLNTFEMKINGYYDWIGTVQKMLTPFHDIRSILNLIPTKGKGAS